MIAAGSHNHVWPCRRYAISSDSRRTLRQRQTLLNRHPKTPTLAIAAAWLTAGVLFAASSGCARLARGTDRLEPKVLTSEISNPVSIPQLDRWLVMDEISDEIDDYFRIYREERIRIENNLVTEGWIETYPEIGSTILEPWRHDSVRGFERLHATLQTVRRYAKVRVMPTGDSYMVDVKVFKELEDNPQPIQSAVSGKYFRNDTAVDVDDEEIWENTPGVEWIKMGRDIALEQKILGNIVRRLSGADVSRPPSF